LSTFAAVTAILALPGGASAAEPVPFATASAPCSNNEIVFPIQSTSHPDAIFHFKSIGAEGSIGSYSSPELGSARFGVGDSGWADNWNKVEIGAGTAPRLTLNCSSGSVEATLAERSSTPTTLSGATSAGSESNLPFTAPGEGQYVLALTISQGGLEVSGVSGIVQSSGEYPLGHFEGGAKGVTLHGAPGPQAVWSATVKEVPVAINKLSFGQTTCMAPGKGIPATFSTTGNTTITASVTNSSSQTVRELGTFPVREGTNSIAWDGRGAGGASVPSGTYALNLRSTDPQGDVTTAQTSISVDSSAPTIAMTTPTTLLPNQSLGFQVSDTGGCGVASVEVTVTEPGGETTRASFGEYTPLQPNGALQVTSNNMIWVPGNYKWSAKTLDKVGNTLTTTGSFKVLESLPATRCVVPVLAGRTVAIARKLLIKAGCRVGKIERRASRTMRAGRVVRSTPKASAHKPLRAKVNLVVAKHPPRHHHHR
jgi:hypothetical protein